MTPTEQELPWGGSPRRPGPAGSSASARGFLLPPAGGAHEVITVSREYGAGGAEVAKRLAEDLGWTLLDRELMHQAAAVEHVPDAELESLDEQAIRVADRFRLHPPHDRYIHGLKQVVDRAVEQGNVILVGRGTNRLAGTVRMLSICDWSHLGLAGATHG